MTTQSVGYRQALSTEDAWTIAYATLTDGGATIHPHSGNVPTTGYAVAIRRTSRIVPEASFSGRGAEYVERFVTRHVESFQHDHFYLGTWWDYAHCEVVLDLVQVLGDRADAVALGVANNQQAIFDLANGVEIPTYGTGDRAA